MESNHSFAQFDLQGRVALITGASKGIGEAIGWALAQAGAHVLLNGRKPEALAEVVARFEAAGLKASALPGDVGKLDQAKALVPQALEIAGRLDILVNNAASNPVFGPALMVEESAFTKIMTVNVQAPFELAKAAFPELEKNKGCVLNISSIGGLQPEPMLGIYSVSKAALISLTKVLAREWGAGGVRVNAICPGVVKTKFSRPLWENEAMWNHVKERQALNILAEPEDIASLALLLCSPAGRAITGSVYVADGGFLA